MKQFVTVPAQDNKVSVSLMAQAFIGVVMHVEPGGDAADLTLIFSQGQRPEPAHLPGVGLDILRVG